MTPPWFANKILSLYAESPGMRSLLTEIGSAIKVRLDHDTLIRIGQFNDLKIEDVAALIGETAFPRTFLWVEWDADPNILPGWTPNNNHTTNVQQGMLIRNAQMGQVGRIDTLTSTEENIFIMPISTLFDWRKEYSTLPEILEALRDNILQVETSKEAPITTEYLDGMLELRRRFTFDSSPYLEIPDSAQRKMRDVMNSAIDSLVHAEKFMVGLANVLECCRVEDWRITHLVQH